MRGRLVVLLLLVSSLSSTAFAQQTPAQQRADAAQRVVTVITAQYAVGTATLDDVAAWNARGFQAKRDAGLSGAMLIAAAQQWVDRMKALEALANARVHAGAANTSESDKALVYRLEAEMTLAKLRSP